MNQRYNETNVCLLQRKHKKYFKNILKDVGVTNKIFGNIIKPFLTNKSHINTEEIIFKTDNETITDRSVLAEMFNSYHQSPFAHDNNISDTIQAIDLIVQSCLDHSSITHIKTTPKYQISPLTSFNNFSRANAK